MLKLRFTLQAKRDLAEIGQYISKDSPASASRFALKIIKKCEFLAARPMAGRPRHEMGPHIRSTPLGSYIIFYHILENIVEILRIVHGARDIKRLIKNP